MKVLKVGNSGSTKWQQKLICKGDYGGGCGATLLVELSDLYYYPGTGGEETWGYRDPDVCFKCPICFKVSSVPKSINLPPDSMMNKWDWKWYKNE